MTEKGNRVDQAHFLCLKCGHAENADVNAAKNILGQGMPFAICENFNLSNR